MKKYNIIYADPPWNFNFKNRTGLSEKAKNKPVPIENAQDIIDLPVSGIAGDNAVLFLWAMSSELPLALEPISQ